MALRRRPRVIPAAVMLAALVLIPVAPPVATSRVTDRELPRATAIARSAMTPATPRVEATYGRLPLHFEANQGQTDPSVRFLARGAGYTMFFTDTEAVLVLSAGSSGRNTRDRASARRPSGEALRPEAQAKRDVVRMKLVGARPSPEVAGLDELPGRVNYFIGNDPAKWRTNVPTYARVRYRDVYPGVDLVYYGRQRQLEYDFVVAPGADPRAIRLAFEGVERLDLGARGDLTLRTANGRLVLHAPAVYQQIEGARVAVPASFTLVRDECGKRRCAAAELRVGVRVAAYDADRPLVIDPVLSYSTYLGGSGEDEAYGIAVNSAGHAYIVGTTFSINFPIVNAPSFGGGTQDAFVAKLNLTGSALVYSTYLGGSSGDEAHGIAVDSDGNAYITGNTQSTNFPTVNALQPTLRGGGNAFVAKLGSTGSTLLYSTYLGGSGADGGNGIAVDTAGNAYVTGWTQSFDFPIVNASQRSFGGSFDAFVTKLSPPGSAIVYSTYLGGGGWDQGDGIAVDSAGNAYVAGWTQSSNFPTLMNAMQPSFNRFTDAFVGKLSPTGTLIYSTYVGGSNDDRGHGIAVDSAGNAYLIGTTFSTDFPTVNAVQPLPGGSADVFVAKLNPGGSALVYSTYLGGGGSDEGLGIAVDTGGNAYLTGSTDSIRFPTVNAFQPIRAGLGDAFVAKLDPTGSVLVHSTYLGGSRDDSGQAVAADSDGNAYVAGYTTSTNFPSANAVQLAYGGVVDAFVAKITAVVPAPVPAGSFDVRVTCPATATRGLPLTAAARFANSTQTPRTVARGALALHVGELRIVGPTSFAVDPPLSVPVGTLGAPPCSGCPQSVTASVVTREFPITLPSSARPGSLVSVGLTFFGQVGGNTKRKMLGTDACVVEVVR